MTPCPSPDSAAPPAAPAPVYLKDYRPPAFGVRHVDLTFRIFKDHTRVRNVMQIVPLTTDAENTETRPALWLDGEDLELCSVTCAGDALQPNSYYLDSNGLKILHTPESDFTLEIETKIYPVQNTALEGLYVSGGNHCTQCEPHGFRRITFYPDRPDVMSVFTVRIEADKNSAPVLLSNGNRTESGDMPDDPENRHFSVWHDPFPKPCYLFALVAGDLRHIRDSFITQSGRRVDLYIYVRAGDEEQCLYAMESLKKAMKWDEDVYGREYDLDIFNIVAVSDFNMGAMENKSLNIFNTALTLAHPETATDADYARVESVIAHEYFHNWTGNRITCRDWFQLSLKEGLTVFRDQEFSADMNAGAVQRIDDVQLLRRAQFAEDSSPLAHPVRPETYIEINNFYTVTIYEKGAELIRMMRTLMGTETYRKATDLYFDRHDGEAVTCEDFVRCMEDASGLDLTQFWLWYEQAGTPVLEAEETWDAESGAYGLTLRQHTAPTPGQSVKKPLHIPVSIGILNAKGEDSGSRLLELRDSESHFSLGTYPEKPTPSVLRGFSAPVRLAMHRSDSDLRFLMRHDTDGFARWDAGQTLFLRILDSLHVHPESLLQDEDISAFAAVAEDARKPEADKALCARMLSLPDLPTILQEYNPADPSALHAARKTLIQSLAIHCADAFARLYDENHVPEGDGIDALSITQRSLKNTALRYLALHPDAPDLGRFETQYRTAQTMTDRIAALGLMLEADSPVCDESLTQTCLADFHARFHNFPLVIDKWFAIQAATARKDTLARVAALRKHPDFTIRNPNRVRALYASLAMANPACFHDASGEGYRLLCAAVRELNTINPQIAARILTPMREWRRYDSLRQNLMREELESLLALPDLSPDVFEVLTKSLA